MARRPARRVASWDDVKLLEVSLDRLRRWSAPGLLCLGDAAHAMSPVGGVGINLAIQDAVAAARVLAPVLAAAPRDPAAVDAGGGSRCSGGARFPTVVDPDAAGPRAPRVIAPLLGDGRPPAPGRDQRMPLPIRLLAARSRRSRWCPARLVGVGVLPEHAPAFARRAPMPVAH